MNILGIKLTHDAAVSFQIDGKLQWCIELEKLDNNPRHAIARDLADVEAVMTREGLPMSGVDAIAIDGWYHGASRKHPGIDLAPYHEGDMLNVVPWETPLRARYGHLDFPTMGRKAYASYPHLTGHVVGSYAMSPWASNHLPAYAIVWDGGTGARLYIVEPTQKVAVRFVTHLLPYYGTIYGIMGYYAGPYKDKEMSEGAEFTSESYAGLLGRRDWPGKLMSWCGLGQPHAELLHQMEYTNALIDRERRTMLPAVLNRYQQDGVNEHRFMLDVMRKARALSVRDEDILASVHFFLERLLVRQATRHIPKGARVIFTGGSALNIKWNSALRETGQWEDVFVPPCPNDAGSAIGAAACFRADTLDRWWLDWDVFCGPMLNPPPATLPEGWQKSWVAPEGIARLLWLRPEQPIMILHGRAELGPRALGNRSIVVSAWPRRNADRLNTMKGREAWRPVAPICLEEAAPRYFDPGTPDPYMLFDHKVRDSSEQEQWATTHLDGTARLQTIAGNGHMQKILRALESYGGHPVLCNTSANRNGSGFFPDVASAIEWGAVDRIWADGVLYFREEETGS